MFPSFLSPTFTVFRHLTITRNVDMKMPTLPKDIKALTQDWKSIPHIPLIIN